MESDRQPLRWLSALFALSLRTQVAVAALLIAAFLVTPVAPAAAQVITRELGIASYRPVVTINSPTPATYTSVESQSPLVFLHGTADDPQDGDITGTRMRWTVRRTDGSGRTHVLCVGSNFPGTATPGTVALHSDCASRTIKLTVPPGWYEVRREAADKHGNIGADTVDIRKDHVVL